MTYHHGEEDDNPCGGGDDGGGEVVDVKGIGHGRGNLRNDVGVEDDDDDDSIASPHNLDQDMQNHKVDAAQIAGHTCLDEDMEEGGVHGIRMNDYSSSYH